MLVIAFNIIFMSIGFRLSSIVSSSYNKYISYYSIEQSGLAAESGANIALSNSFFARSTPFPAAAFSSGTGVAGTIRITKVAIPGASGIDTVGFKLTIIGADDNCITTTRIRVQGASFSQYGMFTMNEHGLVWQTGDTCFGPFHTQDNINSSGTPRFYGQVSTNGHLVGGTPYFKYPYTPNTNIPLDGKFDDLQSMGSTSGGGAYYNGVKVFVQFKADGSVVVRTTPAVSTLNGWTQTGTGYSVGTIKACTTYSSISALTSSGVLLVNGSELHVKGVLNGKITLGAIGAGSIVMIDSSVVYKDPPPSHLNPTAISDDMLGIVAQNDILVTDTEHPNTSSGGSPDGVKNYTPSNTNNSNGVNINASMYSATGGFGAENYSTRGTDGTLKVVGGIQEEDRTAVGLVGGMGFYKSYDYDLNLQYNSPKGYPLTRFLIQDWRDSTVIVDQSFWQGENTQH
jgi:hypothetical protein